MRLAELFEAIDQELDEYLDHDQSFGDDVPTKQSLIKISRRLNNKMYSPKGKTRDGQPVLDLDLMVSNHLIDRAVTRGISNKEIEDALKKGYKLNPNYVEMLARLDRPRYDAAGKKFFDPDTDVVLPMKVKTNPKCVQRGKFTCMTDAGDIEPKNIVFPPTIYRGTGSDTTPEEKETYLKYKKDRGF